VTMGYESRVVQTRSRHSFAIRLSRYAPETPGQIKPSTVFPVHDGLHDTKRGDGTHPLGSIARSPYGN